MQDNVKLSVRYTSYCKHLELISNLGNLLLYLLLYFFTLLGKESTENVGLDFHFRELCRRELLLSKDGVESVEPSKSAI